MRPSTRHINAMKAAPAIGVAPTTMATGVAIAVMKTVYVATPAPPISTATKPRMNAPVAHVTAGSLVMASSTTEGMTPITTTIVEINARLPSFAYSGFDTGAADAALIRCSPERSHR